MPSAKAAKASEVDRVYQTLREWLIQAKLRPGEFLSEAQLAERCRTSRTPIREACTRLAQDKWLSLIRRKGYLVTPVSVRDIVELYEYRKLLECFTAEKVARSASYEQIAELKTILSAESDRRSPWVRFSRRTRSFTGAWRNLLQISVSSIIWHCAWATSGVWTRYARKPSPAGSATVTFWMRLKPASRCAPGRRWLSTSIYRATK